jgi:predicted permease
MLIGGWLISLWVLYTAIKNPHFRFAGIGFIALCSLLVSQVLFRDIEAALFLARYSPTAIALASLMMAATYNVNRSQLWAGLTVLWVTTVITVHIYILYFFLSGMPTSASWKI